MATRSGARIWSFFPPIPTQSLAPPFLFLFFLRSGFSPLFFWLLVLLLMLLLLCAAGNNAASLKVLGSLGAAVLPWGPAHDTTDNSVFSSVATVYGNLLGRLARGYNTSVGVSLSKCCFRSARDTWGRGTSWVRPAFGPARGLRGPPACRHLPPVYASP